MRIAHRFPPCAPMDGEPPHPPDAVCPSVRNQHRRCPRESLWWFPAVLGPRPQDRPRRAATIPGGRPPEGRSARGHTAQSRFRAPAVRVGHSECTREHRTAPRRPVCSAKAWNRTGLWRHSAHRVWTSRNPPRSDSSMALSGWRKRRGSLTRRGAPAFGQQAPVTASHATNGWGPSSRWWTARSRCRPTRTRFYTTPWTDAKRWRWAADLKRRIWRPRRRGG